MISAISVMQSKIIQWKYAQHNEKQSGVDDSIELRTALHVG